MFVYKNSIFLNSIFGACFYIWKIKLSLTHMWCHVNEISCNLKNSTELQWHKVQSSDETDNKNHVQSKGHFRKLSNSHSAIAWERGLVLNVCFSLASLGFRGVHIVQKMFYILIALFDEKLRESVIGACQLIKTCGKLVDPYFERYHPNHSKSARIPSLISFSCASC